MVVSQSNNSLQKVEFIGRHLILDKFDQFLASKGKESRILFCYGEGGIGKTRLLLQLLDIACAKDPNAFVACELVDLYHIHTHTPEGFLRVLAETLPGGMQKLPRFQRKISELDASRLAGESGSTPQLLEDVQKALLEDLSEISKRQRILLAFDTAERWVYSPITGVYKAEAWETFLNLALKLENTIFLLAGREKTGNIPAASTLIRDARERGISVDDMPLLPFTADETQQYINAALKSRGAMSLSPAETNAIWTLTEGRPISLALLLDYYLFSTRDRSLQSLIDEAGQFYKADLQKKKEILTAFEKRIVERIMNNPQVADILRAIGRAPKGVDSDLLGRLLDIDPHQAFLRLDPVKDLVFIKQYRFNKEYKLVSGEPRRFLHDRMYDLLRDTIYTAKNDFPAAQRAYEKIKTYYLENIAAIMSTLSDLYSPTDKILGPARVNLREILEWETRRHQMYSELVYYSLRQPEPYEGLEDFCRYSHEAVLTNSVELLTLLGQELVAYLAGIDPNCWANPNPAFQFFAGKLLLLLDVERAFALNRHGDVISLAKTLRKQISSPQNEYEKEALVLVCAMDAWRGYACVLTNRYKEAEEILSKAIRELEALDTDKSWLQWFSDYALGLANRALGYYWRVRGQHDQATEHYGEAMQLWKRINFLAELAYTKNDNGFAQAEQGKFFDALENINEALGLRRDLGLGRQIGLSLNTKALLEIRMGEYQAGLDLATDAYRLFESLGHRRGLGLAMIALAEACRRLSNTEDTQSESLYPIRYLLQAMDYSTRAAELFSKEQLDEVSREIEARIELGCALRDRIKHGKDLGVWESINLCKQSEEALRIAANLAHEQGIAYREVDALVNLAWLRFTVDHQTQEGFIALSEAIQEAEAAFHLYLPLAPGKQPDKDQVNILWTQFGKLCVLKGNAAIEQWRVGLEDKTTAFAEAAKDYLLTLESNRVFGEDSREMRQAKRWIIRNTNSLGRESLPDFVEQVILLNPEGSTKKPNYLQEFLTARGLWAKRRKQREVG